MGKEFWSEKIIELNNHFDLFHLDFWLICPSFHFSVSDSPIDKMSTVGVS